MLGNTRRLITVRITLPWISLWNLLVWTRWNSHPHIQNIIWEDQERGWLPFWVSRPLWGQRRKKLRYAITNKILVVGPQGRGRPRLIVIVKIMIFFLKFLLLSRRMTWHLYLHRYFYGVCHSRGRGCLHQIVPCGKTSTSKGCSVNISQIALLPDLSLDLCCPPLAD